MRVAYARPGLIRTHVSLPYLDVVIRSLSLAYCPRGAQEQRLPMIEPLEETRQRKQYFEEVYMRKLRVILSDDEPEGGQS